MPLPQRIVTNRVRLASRRGPVLNLGESSFSVEAARGSIDGLSTVNKFGWCGDVDTGAFTDIWSGGNGGNRVWVAPTQARIHDLVSGAAADDQTIRVFGLTAWDQEEVFEDVLLNGVTPVPTIGSYVIIHRMRIVPPLGTTTLNAGLITATAQGDATITAQIEIGDGQTLMAIYGWPSTKDLLVTRFYLGLVTGGAGVQVEARALVCPFPDQDETGFLVKHVFPTVASTAFKDSRFDPPARSPGPGIIKISAFADSTNETVMAGFDGYLADTAQ